jgi:FkbM family methyltransferase
MKNVILDVGANDGIDGLGYALFNKHLDIYAFEANPTLVEKIQNNKEKIESFFKIPIKNYNLINKAVSNFNGSSDFYISEYDLCSSLLKYKFVKTKKKITCDVITLEKFCNENKIDNIVYLHTDTQGSDLNVLQGLNEYKKKLHTGVIETIIKKEKIRYEGASTLDEFEIFFKSNDYFITNKIFNDRDLTEINVYFKNKNISDKEFISKNEFNRRFIQRIVNERVTLKDKIFSKYIKLFKI